MKCLVKDCENYLGEGQFIGPMCAPCHKYYETGIPNNSQAERNERIDFNEDLFIALSEMQSL